MKTWISKMGHIFVLGRKPVSSAYKETFQERNKDLHLICRRQTVVTIAASFYLEIFYHYNQRNCIFSFERFLDKIIEGSIIFNVELWRKRTNREKKVFSWGVSVSQTKFPTAFSALQCCCLLSRIYIQNLNFHGNTQYVSLTVHI